jgi:hypothetical protein
VPSDPISLALIRHLCRDGSLDGAGIDQIAADLDADGLSDEAHAVRCQMLQAAAPSQSEWEAERRRSRMGLVSDGV